MIDATVEGVKMFGRKVMMYSAQMSNRFILIACFSALSIVNLPPADADQNQTGSGSVNQSSASAAGAGSLSPAGTTAETAIKTKAQTASKSKSDTKAKSRTTLDSYLQGQLAREKDKHHQYFEGLAKNATETGRYEAERLRAQAAGKRLPTYTPDDNAYQPMSARVPGYTPSQAGLPPKSPVYVSQEMEWAKMKEDMAAEKAAALRKVAAEKEASLQQSMDNMKSQMKESHVPGAAVARPDGSNLFVRYYGPSDPNKKYEVHPAAARIVPHQ